MDLTQAYRALDPLAPLTPDSDYYVARPNNPMDRVRVDLKLSDRQRHYLLTGHRGTGKTTELRRLASTLRGERDVLLVDVSEQAEVTESGLGRVLETAIVGSLGETGVLSPDAVLDNITSRNVILFDGLERFVESDVVKILNGSVPAHAWPASMICTIPLSLYLASDFGEHARNFDRSIFLPGISVVDQEGVPEEKGLESLSSIVRRRTGEEVFTPEAFSHLALQSAGIHRELLQLAQRACVVAALDGATQVSHSHAEAAIREQRNEYSVVLRTGDFPILHALMQSKDLPGGSEASRLIRNQLIVAYANGTTWFDVHPILRPLIESRGPRWV